MARPKSSTLTDAELRIMQILWQRGSATVADVTEALAQETNPPAYTTVLTLMRILEQKGVIDHEKEGRAFVYKPLVPQTAACQSAVQNVVERFFNNSAELLVLNLLENRQLSAKELKRLKKMITEA